MKLLRPLLALLFVGVSPASAREPATPAGHWQGAITLPGTSLAIRVDLEEAAGEWTGSIDIPAQSLRGFKLGAVTVQAAEVSFTMPGVPGDPSFAGDMAEDGMTLSGTMTQGGQGFPFALERKPKPAAGIGATPHKGVPGKGLIGHWQASLKPTPVIELRLVLEITSVPSGASEGTLISVDQN